MCQKLPQKSRDFGSDSSSAYDASSKRIEPGIGG
jgi:hypothetical protein